MLGAFFMYIIKPLHFEYVFSAVYVRFLQSCILYGIVEKKELFRRQFMRSRPLVRALKTIGWIGLIINLIFFLIIINFMFHIQEDGNLLTKLAVLIILVGGGIVFLLVMLALATLVQNSDDTKQQTQLLMMRLNIDTNDFNILEQFSTQHMEKEVAHTTEFERPIDKPTHLEGEQPNKDEK